MKRVLLLICAMGLISSTCFAAQAEGVPSKKVTPPGVQKTVRPKDVRGKVETVILANLEKETRPKIIILAEDGEKFTFIIRSTTTIYDPGWNPTTLDKIMKGQYVRVKYKINKDGFKVALSIKPSHLGFVPAQNSKKTK
jgi:hypothetical protein